MRGDAVSYNLGNPTNDHPPPQLFRIMVVDDHVSTRRAVRLLLESHAQWVVCGEASDGLEAIDEARRLRPDVIVMDIGMPKMNGLEAAEEISDVLPDARVVLFTLAATEGLVPRAYGESAVKGLVSKQNAAKDLPRAISAVLSGGTYFRPVPDTVH